MHRMQRYGAGGGAAGVFKMEKITMFITGKCISIDMRGVQIPTPKPRPHIPVLYRKQGFTPSELYTVVESADSWMYSRSIGVMERVVSFTLGDDWEEDKSPRGIQIQRSRVHGEIEQFVEFIRSEFPDWVEAPITIEAPPYTYLDQYD